MNSAVPATSTTPTIAMTVRSILGYGELVRRSMSDPRRDLGPCLPRPVELPVRAAQVETDDGEDEDHGDDREEHDVLRAAIVRQPQTRGAAARPIEPWPDREQRDQQARKHDAAEERAVDRER